MPIVGPASESALGVAGAIVAGLSGAWCVGGSWAIVDASAPSVGAPVGVPAGADVIIGANVPPGGKPVVSIGITPVATGFSVKGTPHLGQRPASEDEVWPQRAQTMGKWLM
jgi:hypothetical protein